MAGIDKRLTDLPELTNPNDGVFVHVVDPFNIADNPAGSSFKVKRSNFGGLSDAPSNGNTYGRKDAEWVEVSETDVTADHLKGNWLASTNTPTLTNGVGQIGDYYIVTTEGTQFGILFKVNDVVAYNGSTWYRLVNNNQSPVLTTNTNITSADLSTQDVAGFVSYINALNPIITLVDYDIRNYTVTDTGQKFQLLLRGRSFGFSEPAIAALNVLEISPVLLTQISITTSVSITTATLSSNGISQFGKHVLIKNGVNAINITVDGVDSLPTTYQKEGTGTITFVQGSGRTLRQVSGTAVLSGAVGSTASLSSDGTTDSLRISNA